MFEHLFFFCSTVNYSLIWMFLRRLWLLRENVLMCTFWVMVEDRLPFMVKGVEWKINFTFRLKVWLRSWKTSMGVSKMLYILFIKKACRVPLTVFTACNSILNQMSLQVSWLVWNLPCLLSAPRQIFWMWSFGWLLIQRQKPPWLMSLSNDDLLSKPVIHGHMRHWCWTEDMHISKGTTHICLLFCSPH